MDRGRDRERERDRRDDRDSEVTQMGRGESYRPNTNTRPRSPIQRPDLFRDRSPRRERARTPPIDSYHPGRERSPRRRSRSRTPPRRERSPLRDNWRARPRSPLRTRSPLRARSPLRNRSPPRARSPLRARSPPRRFSPRRDDRRARSPPRRDERRRSRSPFERDRPLQRPRSPFRRSPPAGPRGGFRPRSRSIDRRDDRPPAGPSAGNWRRRSPSPASGRTSGNTSRRSSPPIHPDRMHLTQPVVRDSRPRSPLIRERSPPIQIPFREKDSAKSTPRERSPVRPVAPRSPPRGPAGFRAPTGPSGARNFTAPVHTTMPIHTSNHSTPVVPPAGPRGYVPPVARGGYRGGRGSFGSDRNSRPDSSSWGAAPPHRGPPEIVTRAPAPATHNTRPIQTPSPVSSSTPSVTSVPTGPAVIPTGPRAGVPSRPPILQHSSSVYGRSPSISIANNGPRAHPALNNMPQIIPGGRIDPTATGMTPDITSHMKKLEEEEDILRAKLYSKEETLRQSLKQWDKLSRESAAMSLRTELSERHVRQLAGEGVGGAAF
ncbi:hypothetical protein VTL71DRAFT_2754 [Oculimacula yallundae]|uniref:Serine/arginine repetitive matrix protein 1 n=1 Tax=Oculimacula yallundae TaxID=86028 RepID=A0ABR4C9Q7_9HELO